jgi:hypothetical protein
MKPNNYLKLSVRASKPLHDSESLRQASVTDEWPLLPHGYPYNGLGDARLFVTSWIFTFDDTSKADAIRALAEAQEKRKRLKTKHFELPHDAIQLSSWAPSGLRGVRVVGEPIVAPAALEAVT